MKKDKFYVYLPMILGIVLIILSILNSFENNNVWGIIGGVLLIIIPYVYTSIPIIYERYKENNSLKNRLSENTFTDRQTDLQNLISLLHNHKIIQLTGNERQCGKSWLALKLIDCINHPNDVDFIHHHSLKKLFKRIYYIDMKQKSDSDINYFFENNIVTNKTLIIIDHIKKVDYIFSKQEAYNFSLIFITASIVDTKGEIYYISVSYNTSADVGMQLLTTADFTELDEKTLAASLSNSGEISVEYDDTYGGSTIYSAVKVDILNRVYSVEHGVTVESPAVSYNGADVKDSVTMAFGVEVTAPPDWKEQEEIQDVNGYETYEKVVVVAGVAYVIYRVGRVVVATCVGGPVLGGVAAVAP